MAEETYTDRYGNDVSQDELFKDKSPSEQTALKYFYGIPKKSGCFGREYVTDEEYQAIVDEQIGSLESRKARALSRLGLDEDQVREIPPVSFQGFATLADEVKGIKRDLVTFTEGRKFVTPTAEVTWLFFGNEQVYVYKVRVDTCDNSLKSERTQEYFYKDVTAFASSSDSVRAKVPKRSKGCGGETIEYQEQNVEAEAFRIVVPGETFRCALSPDDGNETKISAMKQKLREKKNG